MIFIKTLHKIFKLGLILHIMNKIGSWVKGKKLIGLRKDELGGQKYDKI